jgi:hypothetical protein
MKRNEAPGLYRDCVARCSRGDDGHGDTAYLGALKLTRAIALRSPNQSEGHTVRILRGFDALRSFPRHNAKGPPPKRAPFAKYYVRELDPA